MSTNSDPNCDCHKEISLEADLAIRTSQYELSPETLAKVASFKEKIAKLYSELDLKYFPLKTGAQSYQDLIVEAFRSESLYEAKKHLQLASYYITHAITSEGIPSNSETLSAV